MQDGGVELGDGTLLASRTVIGTIRTQANALVAAMGLPTERGRIVVVADLAVPGHASV